jgi:YcaO-like protein with predicted kinase domain
LVSTLDLESSLQTPAAKGFRVGTDRLVDPEQTVARVRRLMPVMGITRIANVTGLDGIGVPVVMVCRPNSRSLAVAQGKGLTLAAAKASGLMESVETFHAERIALPLLNGCYEDVCHGHRMIDVDRLPRPPGSSYHPYLPLLWVEGVDLLSSDSRLLPYDVTHTDYRVNATGTTGVFSMTSNGLASGNHRLEAISHGICEVVERDCSARWARLSEAQKGRTRLDLSTVDDAGCRWVLERFDAAGVAVGVWDQTSDIGLPSFRCDICDRSEDRLRGLYAASGMGCHPRRVIALLRALTEAAQSRLTAIAGSRDDAFRSEYDRTRDADALRATRALLDSQDSSVSFSSVPDTDFDTFEGDVGWELDRLQRSGVQQVVVVNLTRAELGLPVVRIVIPGLEPDDSTRRHGGDGATVGDGS